MLSPLPLPACDTPTTSPERIGLLCHDAQDVSALVEALIGHGYDCEAFTNTTELGQSLAHTPLAAVLVMHPHLLRDRDGLVTLRAQLGAFRELVAVCDQTDIQARLTSVRAGVTRHLLWPLPPVDLCAALDEWLSHQRRRPHRVLIVDDSAVTLRHHAQMLTNIGLDVLTLRQPLQLLEAVHSYRPDVVVLDIYMPEVNGIELAAVLRQEAALIQTPILFLSSEEELDLQLQALNAGGDYFLLKPVTPVNLVGVVSTLAERSRKARRLCPMAAPLAPDNKP